MQQLDIFADGRDVALRSDVAEQLPRRDAAVARTALTLLAREYPNDGTLAAMTALVDEIENVSTLPVTDHAELDAICHHLEGEVVRAARQVLSERNAQSWLAPCWRALARRATALPYRGADSDSHAATLWLRAGEYHAASDAIDTIESWWRIPVTTRLDERGAVSGGRNRSGVAATC